MSTFEKLMHENQRVIRSGVTNSLIRNHVENNQQGIATECYNEAVVTFNKAVEKYNEYIAFKNNQFKNLTMKDADILSLLSASHHFIETSEQARSYIKSDNFNLFKLSLSLGKSIKSLKKNLEEEDRFATKYVKTLKPLRIFLFYKKT